MALCGEKVAAKLLATKLFSSKNVYDFSSSDELLVKASLIDGEWFG